MRIPISPREKVTYIKLRQKGYTINCIADAFGRSTSIIHRVLRNHSWLTRRMKLKDLRKIPNQIRQLHCRYSPRILQRYLKQWETFILSETGDPP